MMKTADPWRVPLTVAQIPDTGLHRDFQADQAVREAIADVGGLREVLSASASLDVMPKSQGRVHVTGHVRARIGQTCVVTLDPIENEIDEPIDLVFAPPEQIPELSDLVDEAAESEVEIPDPPEPIINGVIDLGRLVTDALVPGRGSLPAQAGRGFPAADGIRRPKRSPVCGAQGAAARRVGSQEASGQARRR